MDGFDDHPEMVLAYFFFTMATFFTQVTFFNMLIAIMGDTFGRVIENKSNFGLQTKLSIMGDYTAVIDEKNSLKTVCCKSKYPLIQDKENYLFIVKPKSDGDDDNSAWEGGLGLIKKSIEHQMQNLNKSLNKNIEKVAVQNLEAKARDSTLEKEVRNQYQRITQRFLELEEKQSSQNSKDHEELLTKLRVNGKESNSKLQHVIDYQMNMLTNQQTL